MDEGNGIKVAESRRPGVGVAVMFLNSEGLVLLGKRHDDPEKADSELKGEGTWTLPGRKLDFHEGLKEGAAREAFEEAGLTASGLELISVGNERIPGKHFVTIGFKCVEFDGEPQVMEPDEITEWRWFPFDGLPEPMFPPALKIIENYRNNRLISD